jgi:hypothetical protein
MASISHTTITLDGANGSGESDTLNGFLTNVYINYTGVGAGTTVKINQVINGITETLYTLVGNTDVSKRIELPTVDASDAATDQFIVPYIPGMRLDFAVTLSSAGTIVITLITTG